MICAEHLTHAEKLPYIAWHAKAEEWERARRKNPTTHGAQERCAEHARWFFPWERREVMT